MLDSAFVDNSVLFAQYNHVRLPAPRFGAFHFRKGHDGQPIAGLYAAGNVMASAMGMTYGGGGGTLGPAMVFGYLAGQYAAEAAINGSPL